jgi:hypothetical protein
MKIMGKRKGEGRGRGKKRKNWEIPNFPLLNACLLNVLFLFS